MPNIARNLRKLFHGRDEASGLYNTVQIVEPQKEDPAGSGVYTVVVDQLDPDGEVVKASLTYNVDQLRGFIWSMEMCRDVCRPLRNCWDTPLGFIMVFGVIFNQYFVVPVGWYGERPGWGLFPEDDMSFEMLPLIRGVPDWSQRPAIRPESRI